MQYPLRPADRREIPQHKRRGPPLDSRTRATRTSSCSTCRKVAAACSMHVDCQNGVGGDPITSRRFGP
eukprot:1974913-Pyramimonas_sp.AAC.1